MRKYHGTWLLPLGAIIAILVPCLKSYAGPQVVNISLTVSAQPSFVQHCTGRSEGVFATFFPHTDTSWMLFTVADGKTNRLGVASVSYRVPTSFKCDAKVGESCWLALLTAEGRLYPLLHLRAKEAGAYEVAVGGDNDGMLVDGGRMATGATFSLTHDAAAPLEKPVMTDPGDPCERLKKLKELHDAGILTPEEYREKRDQEVKRL